MTLPPCVKMASSKSFQDKARKRTTRLTYDLTYEELLGYPSFSSEGTSIVTHSRLSEYPLHWVKMPSAGGCRWGLQQQVSNPGWWSNPLHTFMRLTHAFGFLLQGSMFPRFISVPHPHMTPGKLNCLGSEVKSNLEKKKRWFQLAKFGLPCFLESGWV